MRPLVAGALLLAPLCFATPAHAQQACGWLPSDRMDWWTATPPASAPLRPADTFDCWLEAPLHEVREFTGVAGSDVNSGQVGYAFRNTSVLTDANLKAAVPRRVTRTIGEVRYQEPLVIDFANPQRAVALEFGLLFDEGYVPLGSAGSGRIDAEGLELRAYDATGAVIGTATLASPVDATGGRTSFPLDLRIGFRDQAARITAVSLLLLDENARTASAGTRRAIRAVPVVKRIHHEALPAAAVKEGYLATAPGDTLTTLHVVLPYRLDQATVLMRGQRFGTGRETLVPRFVLFDLDAGKVKIDPLTGVRSVDLTLDADIHDGSGKKLGDAGAYYTLLAWEGNRVRAQASATAVISGPTQPFTTAFADVAHPCATCDDDHLIALMQGMTLQSVKTELDGWDARSHELSPCAALGNSGRRMVARTQQQAPYALFPFTHAFVLGGLDVRADRPVECNQSFSLILPQTVWRYARGGVLWDHYEEDMARYGLAGQIDALVAGVAMTSYLIDPDQGGPVPVGGMDIELSAVNYDGRQVSVRLGGGGVSTTIFGAADPEPSTYFAVPTFVGLVASTGVADLMPTSLLEFTAFQVGTAVGPTALGGMRNAGAASILLTDAQIVGAGKDRFTNLEIVLPGGGILGLAALRQIGLNVGPGQTFSVRAAYTNAGEATARGEVQFTSSGGATVARRIAVVGRIRPPGDWLPAGIGFGSVDVGQTAVKRALFEGVTGQNLAVLGFVEEADPYDELTVGPGTAMSLTPGTVALQTLTFTPRASAPPGQRIFRVLAKTALGDVPLQVTAIAAPPPVPKLVVDQDPLQLGLVAPGHERTLALTLRSTGTAALVVSSISGLSGELAVVSQPALPAILPPDAETLLQVRFRPSAATPAGTLITRTLRLVTNAGTINVTVTAVVGAP